MERTQTWRLLWGSQDLVGPDNRRTAALQLLSVESSAAVEACVAQASVQINGKSTACRLAHRHLGKLQLPSRRS